MFIVTYTKDFGNFSNSLRGEMEWVIAVFENKEPALKLAEELIELPTINITFERFNVYDHNSKLKRFVKNKSKLIY